jgi:hypothetical protein
MRALPILLLLLLLSACGDDGRFPVDTGASDTSITADSSVDSATPPDTGTVMDTGTSGDTSTAMDSSAADAVVMDSGTVDTAIPDAGPVTGQYVVDFLDIAREGAVGVVAGMNIDGRNSDASDAAGCFHPDFMSPAPDSEIGVDNQLGPLVDALGSSFTVDFAPYIAAGDLIILAQVSGSGSTVNIELFQGEVPGGGAPVLSGGRLAPGQTFDVVTSIGVLTGAETGGRTRVGPQDTTLPIIPGAAPIDVYRTEIYGTVTSAGIADGVVGGGARTSDASSTLAMLDPTLPIAIINAVLDGQADLAPDSSGNCQQLSAGLVYTAVPATFTP